MNDFKKYLPSKKFVLNILVILGLIAIFFIGKWVINIIKEKRNGKEVGLDTITIDSIAQKDSNNNGIADWEESIIWGLNPNKDGQANKEFIMAKKKALEESGIISEEEDAKKMSQNQALSRQFFAAILSLQQTGDLDEESMSSISNSIGQNIKTEPIPDVYTKEMLLIKSDNQEAKSLYYNTFIDLTDRYDDKDIGSELTIIAQGIVNSDVNAIYSARTIATAYRDFGKDLLKIPVPSSMALIHLHLANSYEKTAQSIEGLTQVATDPIIGMRSILNYKKYTEEIVKDIDELEKALQ